MACFCLLSQSVSRCGSTRMDRSAFRSVEEIKSDLVDWKLFLPSDAARSVLTSPSHSSTLLMRSSFLWRLPADCLGLILEYVSIGDLVVHVARTCRGLSILVRRASVWRHFNLTELVERSGLLVGRSASDRAQFWMTQLFKGRFRGLSAIEAVTAVVNHRGLRAALTESPTLHTLDLSHCDGFDDLCALAVADSLCNFSADGVCRASLRDVRLNFCGLFNGYTLCEALRKGGNLQALELSGCVQLSETDIQRFVFSIPTLKSLRLRATRASSASFERPSDASYGPSALQILDLACCRDISDGTLGLIASTLPNLTWLSVESTPQLTDTGILSLCCSTLRLRTLLLGGCGKLTDTSLLRVAQTFHQTMECITVDRSRISGGVLCDLMSLPQLEYLSCTACLYALRDVSASAEQRRVVTSHKYVLSDTSRKFLGVRGGFVNHQVERKSKKGFSIITSIPYIARIP